MSRQMDSSSMHRRVPLSNSPVTSGQVLLPVVSLSSASHQSHGAACHAFDASDGSDGLVDGDDVADECDRKGQDVTAPLKIRGCGDSVRGGRVT